MNVLTISGTLGADAKVFTYGDNKQGVKFRIANNFFDGKENKTLWIDVTSFRAGEKFVALLNKGTKVIVSGRVDLNTFKLQDGTERTTMQVLANDVDIVEVKEKVQQDTGTSLTNTSDDAYEFMF